MSNNRNPYNGLKGRLNVTGENINRIRVQQNLSAQALSDKLILFGIDISSQSIFDIEKGTRTVIDYELCAIAKILDTTSDELMEDFKHYLDQFN